jgi:hypothetical protein
VVTSATVDALGEFVLLAKIVHVLAVPRTSTMPIGEMPLNVG